MLSTGKIEIRYLGVLPVQNSANFHCFLKKLARFQNVVRVQLPEGGLLQVVEPLSVYLVLLLLVVPVEGFVVGLVLLGQFLAWFISHQKSLLPKSQIIIKLVIYQIRLG